MLQGPACQRCLCLCYTARRGATGRSLVRVGLVAMTRVGARAAAGERERWAACPRLQDGFSWLEVPVASALPLCWWHRPRDPRTDPSLRGHPLATAGQRTGKLITALLSWLLRAAELRSTGRFCAGKNTEFPLFLCAMNQFSCPWIFSAFKLGTQEAPLVGAFLFSVNFSLSDFSLQEIFPSA